MQHEWHVSPAAKVTLRRVSWGAWLACCCWSAYHWLPSCAVDPEWAARSSSAVEGVRLGLITWCGVTLATA